MQDNQQSSLHYVDLANCIRVLTADAVEKAKSGHPGMPLGMADIMTVLAFNFLKFNPHDPKWFDRDRLILSNGHGSMLLYSFYYLTGYIDFDIDDIKNFRQLHSKTPGHPEYDIYPAIEATTGPLGQGFGMAVGMAIAQKKYQHKFGKNFCDYKIYCLVGDGCLMEGISYEAASIAGHLKLNNLILLFDDNHITIDGNINLTNSEDQIAKFQALGWATYHIDGHNHQEIFEALEKAQSESKPVFIACRTIIGKGVHYKANSELSHGSPLGIEEISWLKQHINFKDEPFYIPDNLLTLWKTAWEHNRTKYIDWANIDNQEQITEDYVSKLLQNLNTKLDRFDLITAMPTRVYSGKVIYELMQDTDMIIAGSSDLSSSNNIKNTVSHIITSSDFSGNFIHYGVREHAMSTIMNGLALSGFLPMGGTFLSFSDYMKAGIRLSAMMKQKVIYIMTHDSIGLGEDGPTHQPVEQIAGLRAIPNLLVLRPADMVEVLECYQIALIDIRPVVLVLTRQNIKPIRTKLVDDNLSAKGAYIIHETKPTVTDVCIWATGSELSLALEVVDNLQQANISVRVVSVPSFELFFEQPEYYIKSLQDNVRLHIGIEAACSFGWHKIIGINGKFFGVENFGISAPYQQVYKNFALTKENIINGIKEALAS